MSMLACIFASAWTPFATASSTTLAISAWRSAELRWRFLRCCSSSRHRGVEDDDAFGGVAGARGYVFGGDGSGGGGAAAEVSSVPSMYSPATSTSQDLTSAPSAKSLAWTRSKSA